MVIALKTKRAVGYIRVSDPKQTGERHSSLETQEASYLNYCKQNHLSPITTFTDVVSGRRDDRKEYLRMVDFVKQGGADVVIVKFLDRFGRNPKEILRRYWELQDLGIEVVATDEDIKEELVLLIKAGTRTLRANQTALLPVFVLYCNVQRPERCALTRLRYSPLMTCIYYMRKQTLRAT